MAISKKGKRILWIAIPVAVLAIAALLIIKRNVEKKAAVK